MDFPKLCNRPGIHSQLCSDFMSAQQSENKWPGRSNDRLWWTRMDGFTQPVQHVTHRPVRGIPRGQIPAIVVWSTFARSKFRPWRKMSGLGHCHGCRNKYVLLYYYLLLLEHQYVTYPYPRVLNFYHVTIPTQEKHPLAFVIGFCASHISFEGTVGGTPRFGW